MYTTLKDAAKKVYSWLKDLVCRADTCGVSTSVGLSADSYIYTQKTMQTQLVFCIRRFSIHGFTPPQIKNI